MKTRYLLVYVCAVLTRPGQTLRRQSTGHRRTTGTKIDRLSTAGSTYPILCIDINGAAADGAGGPGADFPVQYIYVPNTCNFAYILYN